MKTFRISPRLLTLSFLIAGLALFHFREEKDAISNASTALLLKLKKLTEGMSHFKALSLFLDAIVEGVLAPLSIQKHPAALITQNIAKYPTRRSKPIQKRE